MVRRRDLDERPPEWKILVLSAPASGNGIDGLNSTAARSEGQLPSNRMQEPVNLAFTAPVICGRELSRWPGWLIPALALTASLFAIPGFAAVTPTGLVCEYQTNPMGIDVAQPRLSWQFAADPGTPRGWRQTAYEIQAASTSALLTGGAPDLWDSQQIASGANTFITYGGSTLKTSEQVFWRVREWDENGNPSAWSATAAWTMGLLAQTDWKGSWIMMPTVTGATYPNTATSITGTAVVPQSVMARRDFVVGSGTAALTRAVLTFCGLGCYEFTINGVKVGQNLFPPGWTLYTKTCLYDTYDVTSMLVAGANTAAFVLGNGMYNIIGGRYTKFTDSYGEKKAIGQLRLDYSDGTTAYISTDATWRINPGPLTFSCVFGGEDCDARLQPAGWNLPGYNATGWHTPLITGGPGGALKGLSQAAPPVQAIQTISPVKSTTVATNTIVYDLGQTASYMPRITVTGTTAAYVTITPAELDNSDGTIQLTDGTPSYMTYTLSGTASQTWMPRFFYRGARYFQVKCYHPPSGGAVPVVNSFAGVVVHSISTPVGSFTCSDALFNNTQNIIRWSQASNMESILTDCPQREKTGWLEQDHLNGPSLRYNFDLGQLYTKIIMDIMDNQQANGQVYTVAPDYPGYTGDGFGDSPEWSSTFIQAAWQQYQFTGDTRLLSAAYTGMKSYLAYLGSRASGYIINYGLGDWYDDQEGNNSGASLCTPAGVTPTCYYYEDASVMAQIARVLGYAVDATTDQALAANIASAFNARFFSPATGTYSIDSPSGYTNPLLGSQTANAMPLELGMVATSNTSAVLNAIVQDLVNRNLVFTSGEIGFRYLLRALTDYGRPDMVFAFNNQSANAGYGYVLASGATSMTESMLANANDSQIHFMWGEITEWFYHDLAGIQNDASGGGGFKRIIISPTLTGGMTSVSGSYNAISGTIIDQWNRNGKNLTMNVAIPPNTSATVYVPAADPGAVTEGAVAASGAAGVTYTGTQGGSALFQVGSGFYSFVSQPAGPYADLWTGDGTANVWSAGGPANWTTYGGAASFGQGDAISFDGTGSDSPSIQLTGTLSPSAVSVSGSNSYAFAGSGMLSGTMSLVKSGSGVLILSEANAYSGGTIVNGGTVELDNANALLDTTVTAEVTNALTFNNSASESASYTIGGLTGAGGISLSDVANNPVNLIVGNNNGSSTYMGILGGAGSLQKTGAGTLILDASSTYSGPTTIAGGTLQLAHSVIPSTPASGSTLWLDATRGVTTSGSNVISWADQSGSGNNATGIAGRYATYSASGLGGAPALAFNGSAFLSDPVSASSAAETVLAVVQPSVLANGSEYTIIGASSTGGLQLRFSGNELQFVDEYIANIANSSETVAIGSPSLVAGTTQSGSQAFYVNLQLSGTASDIYSLGSGLTSLIGENGENGQENLNGYLSALLIYPTVLTPVQLAETEAFLYSEFIGIPPGYSNGALPATAVNLSQPGATLDLDGQNSGIGLLTGVEGSNIILGGATLNIQARNGPGLYAGNIEDAGGAGTGAGGGIIKSGTGTLTLSGALTYSGTTQVDAGVLCVAGSLLSSGPLNILNGAVLNLAAGIVSSGTVQILAGGTLNGSGIVNAPVINNGTAASSGSGQTLAFNGSVVNNGTFIFTGGASLQAAGKFVNNGLLDVMTGVQTLPAGLLNNGIVLDASAVKVNSTSYASGTFTVSIQSYAGHTYQLQFSLNPGSGTWINLGPPASGTGGLLSFPDSPGSSESAGFYRVLVYP